ncbi:hypothetical protein [Blastococcus brunescens]|uniref:Uncharacterized protein n=1 Tax=Blastococcus brunescens TaxID=1564165 RepID=A0ABZ1B4R9_9ACTN|nr:hypothetical protein [Blastococcus sp. BMG 8361]WRL65151.1 hypothetical protein U6N30_05575 [Blastococcus sp. BMG 8361]
MTGIRRVLILIGLTLLVTVGAAIPASATFTESATVPPASIATGTVAAPGWVSVDDYCITRTTTTKRTVYTDPVTGVQTQTAYSSTWSEARNTYNEQSSVPTTVAGPGAYETTTTTVTKATDLVVNLSWGASGSRGVSGYVVSAHPYGGAGTAMAQTPATQTWMGARVTAYYLDYAATLSVTTLTSYGWTKQSAQTARLSC